MSKIDTVAQRYLSGEPKDATLWGKRARVILIDDAGPRSENIQTPVQDQYGRAPSEAIRPGTHKGDN